MACRSKQAQYPVYNILVSGVNTNNNYEHCPNVRPSLFALAGNRMNTVESSRWKIRERAAQTVFRESESQTDPFASDMKRPFDYGLHVLTLSWLSWNNGLPAGIREVTVIERARQKRAWERVLPAPFSAAARNIQRMTLEAIELNEWNHRETELAALGSIRMELARKCMENHLASNKIKCENRVLNYMTVRAEEKQAALQKVRFQLKRKLRKLRHNIMHNNVNRRYHRWNVLVALEDKTSEWYGPQQRFDVHPMRVHELIPKDFCYWNVFTTGDIISHQSELIMHRKDPPFDYFNKSKPLKHVNQLCERETRWTLAELEKIHYAMKYYRRYMDREPRGRSCVLKQTKERCEEHHSCPSVEGLLDEVETACQSALALQRIIKGRAIQAVMFEGRVQCQDLIEEVKSTHALQGYLEDTRAKARYAVYEGQRRAEMKSNEEKRKNEILLSLEGRTVADILDFLSKELVRIQNEREIHAIALMADRERHEKEAFEAGRRQKEEERSREHNEIFRQTCKTYQNSLDAVLEEFDLFMRIQFSAGEARKEAMEYAKKVDQAAKEAHIRSNQLEEEEIIADLVYNFALPEAEKEMVRSRLKVEQKALLSVCHDEIYSQVETVRGSRSPYGTLVSSPRRKRQQYKKKNCVSYVALNKAGASVTSFDDKIQKLCRDCIVN